MIFFQYFVKFSHKNNYFFVNINVEDYIKNGAKLFTDATNVYKKSEIIVKINAPVKQEYKYLHKDLWIIANFSNMSKDEQLSIIKKYKVKKNTVVKYQVKVDGKARKAVEEAAIKYVTKEYQKRGYEIVSREKDNVGWDLDATNGRICLKLEVKGVASSTISVHITHNEKSKMEANKKHYRLCVVINAIKNPQMIVFVWDNSLGKWVSEDDNSIALEIAEIPSYIASVE